MDRGATRRQRSDTKRAIIKQYAVNNIYIFIRDRKSQHIGDITNK